MKPWGTCLTENIIWVETAGNHSKDSLSEGTGNRVHLPESFIFEADFNQGKYATTDYFKIDSQFGTEETFKRTSADMCHSYGIRIVLIMYLTYGYLKPFQDVYWKNRKIPLCKMVSYQSLSGGTPVIIIKECVGAYNGCQNWIPPTGGQEFILKAMFYWLTTELGWLETGCCRWSRPPVKGRVWEHDQGKYPDKILLNETWGYVERCWWGNQMDL